MSDQRTPIDYATPKIPALPSDGLYVVAIGGWAIAAGIGLACLLGYIATLDMRFASAGLLWLAIGGLATLIAMICGAVYNSQARASRYPHPHTMKRASRAVVLPASNFPLALVCAIVGLWRVSTAPTMFDLSLRNATGVQVESVAVQFGDESPIDFGSLEPGEVVTKNVTLGASPIVLQVKHGGRIWNQVAVDYMDADDLGERTAVEFPIKSLE